MYTLEKYVTFEAAHRLGKGYDGKCKNIHGHSWKVTLSLECSSLDSKDLGVDFGVMKKWLREVEQQYDHKLILFEKDPLIEILSDKTEIVEVPFNPTSEALARHIYFFMHKKLQDSKLESYVRLNYVEVSETCTSACKYCAK